MGLWAYYLSRVLKRFLRNYHFPMGNTEFKTSHQSRCGKEKEKRAAMLPRPFFFCLLFCVGAQILTQQKRPHRHHRGTKQEVLVLFLGIPVALVVGRYLR